MKKPEAVICCFSCRKALWVQEVRTTNGTIVSHRTIPCGDNSCAFSETDPACPLCARPYYKVDGKKKKLLVRSTKTGKEFVI